MFTSRDYLIRHQIIVLESGQEIYVECKTHHWENAGYAQVFYKRSNEISAAIVKSALVSSAWKQGLRTAIIPTKTVTSKEVIALAKTLEGLSPDHCKTQRQITTNITVICVPREQPLSSDGTMIYSLCTVGEKPVHIGHENYQLIIHSWAGLDIERGRSQRKLLKEARKKLRCIPHKSVGMICIQTFAVRLFLHDVEKLMLQREYNQIALVWLNPFQEGQVVCRTQYLELRNGLLSKVIQDSRNRQIENCNSRI